MKNWNQFQQYHSVNGHCFNDGSHDGDFHSCNLRSQDRYEALGFVDFTQLA